MKRFLKAPRVSSTHLAIALTGLLAIMTQPAIAQEGVMSRSTIK